MFGYTYLIGDPAKREKIADVLGIVWRSVVCGFALIGVIAVLAIVCQICAW